MIRFINNYATTLAAQINETDTTIVVTHGLPALANGEYFLLTLFNKTGVTESNWEIVKVTSTGVSGGTTLTIERAQEGTNANPFVAGTKVEMRLTAGSLSSEFGRLESLIYAGL